MADDRKPMRLSVTVSADLNDWLDAESKRMAMPKSAIVHIATEKYRQDRNVTDNIPGMLEELKKENLK